MKKEYGKGFTLSDLEQQRQAIWNTRRQVGLTVSIPIRDYAPPAIEQGGRPPLTGAMWSGPQARIPAPTPGEMFLPLKNAALGAERAMQGMVNAMAALGTWPKPYLPGDPTPNRAGEVSRYETVDETLTMRAETWLPGDKPVGFFGGMPVYESPDLSFRFTTEPMGDGYRSTQVGWAKPEPIPEQPTGRFRNLDF